MVRASGEQRDRARPHVGCPPGGARRPVARPRRPPPVSSRTRRRRSRSKPGAPPRSERTGRSGGTRCGFRRITRQLGVARCSRCGQSSMAGEQSPAKKSISSAQFAGRATGELACRLGPRSMQLRQDAAVALAGEAIDHHSVDRRSMVQAGRKGRRPRPQAQRSGMDSDGGGFHGSWVVLRWRRLQPALQVAEWRPRSSPGWESASRKLSG